MEWLPGSDIGHVWIDPAQVDQLLANLCVNARDAIEGHGTITIRTERVEWDVDMDLGLVRVPAGAYVRLSVSDTGCGMDAETLSHVFEPFFTTKPEGRGTGLGLATVYGIVTQNHGWIDVVSQPGEGSRFDIYFPEHRAPAEMAHDVHQSDAPEGEATVLLVEDEPSILAVTRMMLQSCGYQVLSCSAPDEALALARSHPEPIHLLLTDVVMPVANGVALAEQIRSVRPEIRVLYMSGYTADMLADQGLEEMGPLFLAKPFTREALARAVNAVLSCDVT